MMTTTTVIDPKSLCECGHPRNHHQHAPNLGWLCVTCHDEGAHCERDATKRDAALEVASA
jgi:hypothetical protein